MTEMNKPAGIDAVFDAIINNTANSAIFTAKWRGVNILYRRYLDAEEYVDFAQKVVGMCLNESDGTIRIELLDLAFRVMIVSSFTNIELPDDMAYQFKILYWTDIYDFVLERISVGQVESLKQTVDRLVRHIIK